MYRYVYIDYLGVVRHGRVRQVHVLRDLIGRDTGAGDIHLLKGGTQNA
jgi:hypothetical protein